MDGSVLITIIAAIPGLGAAYLAYRQAVKAADTSSKNATLKIESEAYNRAKTLYESAIKQLEDQIGRLRDQVRDEQNVSNGLRKRIYELEETVARLRVQLTGAGIRLDPTQVQTEVVQ